MKTRKQISKEEEQGHDLKEALRKNKKGEPVDGVEDHEIVTRTPVTHGNHVHTGRDGGDRR